MKTLLFARIDPQLLVRLFVVIAILAALATGYAALQLAPVVHAVSGGVPAHLQMADGCLSSGVHC